MTNDDSYAAGVKAACEKRGFDIPSITRQKQPSAAMQGLRGGAASGGGVGAAMGGTGMGLIANVASRIAAGPALPGKVNALKRLLRIALGTTAGFVGGAIPSGLTGAATGGAIGGTGGAAVDLTRYVANRRG